MHVGIERLFGGRRRLGRVAIVLADLVTTVEVALPLTSVWVHELAAPRADRPRLATA